MNVPDTKIHFLSVMILTTSYITTNNNYQVLSIHSTLSIWSYLLLTTTLQIHLFFLLCREKIEARKILNVLYQQLMREKTCIISLQITSPVTSPDSEHEICLEIPLKNSTIVWSIWDMKNQVRILISEDKNCKQSSRSHWDQARVGTGDAYVDYSGRLSPLAVRV